MWDFRSNAGIWYVYFAGQSVVCNPPCQDNVQYCANNACGKYTGCTRRNKRGIRGCTAPIGPLLLTWINFNPNMDKYLHPL